MNDMRCFVAPQQSVCIAVGRDIGRNHKILKKPERFRAARFFVPSNIPGGRRIYHARPDRRKKAGNPAFQLEISELFPPPTLDIRAGSFNIIPDDEFVEGFISGGDY